MQAANRLLTALKAGTPTIGLWQMLPGSNISRILARSNPDFVVVDCEHGNIDGTLPLSPLTPRLILLLCRYWRIQEFAGV